MEALSPSRLPFVLIGAALFAACDVAYPVGLLSDAGPPVQPPAYQPSQREVSIKGIPFACERWGLGSPLVDHERALRVAVQKLWRGDAADWAEAQSLYGGLLQGGRSGDLHCVVSHMLENNRAVRGVGEFYDSWLNLGRYPITNPERFPDYTRERIELMARDARDFAVDVTLRGKDNFRRLFTAPHEISLAPTWNEVPASSRPDLAAMPAGLLTQPGVLTGLRTFNVSPSIRGAWVQRTFLCNDVPPPPPDAIFNAPVGPESGITYRQYYENAFPDGSCMTCHNLMDPIGFALDAFDAVGRLQPLDRFGQPFDLSGVLHGQDGANVAFSSVSELGAALSEQPEAHQCYARRWVQYVSDRLPDETPEQLQSVVGLARRLENFETRPLIAAAFEFFFAPEVYTSAP